jgi:chemotaxis protein MotB
MGEEGAGGGPWPAFADLLAATTLLFLILFAALAVPAIRSAGKGRTLASTLEEIDGTLSRESKGRGFTVERVGDYVLVSIPESATFPQNRYELAYLRPAGRVILQDIGRSLMEDSLIQKIDQVQVVGHTSHEGAVELNWNLSASRSATVALFLVESVGLPPCQITALGRSFYYPVSPEDARRSGKVNPADRRIELEIRPRIPGDSLQRQRRAACVQR